MTNAPKTAFHLLAAKLAAIDMEYESSARGEIDLLYSRATYSNGRFQFPSLQEASEVWLRLITRKDKEFCAEITRVLSAVKHTDKEFLTQGMGLIEGYLDERCYLDRLMKFWEGLGRKAASYGLTLDPQAHRIDLSIALYETGVKNSLRNTCNNISAEFALHNQSTHKNGVWRERVLTTNNFLELKPNFMGFGLNLNAIIKMLGRRKKK